MNINPNSSGKFELFILTYNRSKKIAATLEALSNSIFKNSNITVLNNSSTDNTKSVLHAFESKFLNLKVVTHKSNIGLSANILRAIELSESIYTWILCDDDKLKLNEVEDLFEVINEEEVDLIHVGAHSEISWKCGGKRMTPKDLIESGYHFFKAGSFLTCNIFRTSKFQAESLIDGYNNIVNVYPHIPYLGNLYKNNSLVYLTKSTLVTAEQNQTYSIEKWLLWWLNTSKIMVEKSDVRTLFFDHFQDDPYNIRWLFGIMNRLRKSNESNRIAVDGFISEYFTINEKFMFRYVRYKGMIQKLKNVISST